MNVSRFCSNIIKIGFYLLFALVPLLLTPWNYELFEYNKMMGVYALTTLIMSAWLVRMVSEKEIKITRTPLDIPIVLFFLSQLLSSLFSIDPHVSWFGYYSRFNGGMFSIISYVLLYYAFVSNKLNVKKLLHIALASAFVVALYGVAERLGVDKHLWVQDVQNRVFSTLGQPNWLAAYLVALIPITMAFAIKAQISKLKVQSNIKAQSSKFLKFGFDLSFGFWIWSFISILFFVVLLFTRSRSGLLGFAVADVIFWALIFIRPRLANRSLQGEAFRIPFLLIHIIFAVIIFFNGSNIVQIDKILHPSNALTPTTTQTGPALESGGTESGVIRKYVWQGAINAWKSSTKAILIGTGTETFAFAFYQYRPVLHNMTSEWDFLYNKAHNEYLNYLATTGIFGLGSYLFFIGACIVWFVKTQISKFKAQIKSKVQSSNSLDFGLDLSFGFGILELALFSGWLSILITNFFGFSVVIVQLFLFLFPAMMMTGDKTEQRTLTLHTPSWSVWLPLFIGLVFLMSICSMWYADTRFANGYRQNRSGQYTVAKGELEQAMILNPGEPVYHDEIASTYAALALTAYDEKNATLTATLAQEALSQNDRAIRISPANVNFWKTRTKVYYTLSALDPKLNDGAIESLTRAIRLSPNDPKLYYNLAILNGRSGNNGKAIEQLNSAKNLKSDYRDAYNGLYIFYTELKKTAEAQAIIKEYLTNVDPNDHDFQEKIK